MYLPQITTLTKKVLGGYSLDYNNATISKAKAFLLKLSEAIGFIYVIVLQELSQAASTRTTYINRVRHGKMAASTNVPALTVTLTLTSALLCKYICTLSVHQYT